MIDYHTHILPKMDDGCQSVDESIQALKTLQKQGVETVCLTPHFYPDRTSPERFFARRQASFERLQSAIDNTFPELLLGAEVAYYPGISRMEQLSSLCLQGSKLLLLEMPFCKWSKYVVDEVSEISSTSGVVVLLAHIERYLALQSQREIEQLLDFGVKLQSNAEFFYVFPFRRIATNWIKKEYIDVLGTDTHNNSTRAPHMDVALNAIKQRLGEEFLQTFLAYQEHFLKEIAQCNMAQGQLHR